MGYTKHRTVCGLAFIVFVVWTVEWSVAVLCISRRRQTRQTDGFAMPLAKRNIVSTHVWLKIARASD